LFFGGGGAPPPDAAGYGGASYAFTAALDPALARREYFTAGDPSHALRFFSVS
jgi:hypothetical protein